MILLIVGFAVLIGTTMKATIAAIMRAAIAPKTAIIPVTTKLAAIAPHFTQFGISINLFAHRISEFVAKKASAFSRGK